MSVCLKVLQISDSLEEQHGTSNLTLPYWSHRCAAPTGGAGLSAGSLFSSRGRLKIISKRWSDAAASWDMLGCRRGGLCRAGCAPGSTLLARVRSSIRRRHRALSEKGVRLAQKMQVGPCIPVGIQTEKVEVGPTSRPTWRLSHI